MSWPTLAILAELIKTLEFFFFFFFIAWTTYVVSTVGSSSDIVMSSDVFRHWGEYTNVGTAIEVTRGFRAKTYPKQSQKREFPILNVKKQLWPHTCAFIPLNSTSVVTENRVKLSRKALLKRMLGSDWSFIKCFFTSWILFAVPLLDEFRTALNKPLLSPLWNDTISHIYISIFAHSWLRRRLISGSVRWEHFL